MYPLIVTDLYFIFGPLICMFCLYAGVMILCVMSLMMCRKELTNIQRCITHICGYHSRMSNKNIDTWNFAHHYSIICYMKISTIAIIALIPAAYIFQLTDIMFVYNLYTTIFLCELIMPLIIVRLLTERALRKNFNKDGTKKNSFK